jgi:apolipoprotein N-acyltransferase
MFKPMTLPPAKPLGLNQGILIGAVAFACFQAAYTLGHYVIPQVLIVGYVICLAQLARLETMRGSFYAGLLATFACYAPQLVFFWKLFGAEAILLWLILAFWVGLFVALTHATLARWGPKMAALLLPFIWTGLEYFRSELYYLKFSWLSPGYALIGWHESLLPYVGTYGCGFLVASIAAVCLVVRRKVVVTLVALCLLTVLQFAIPKLRAQTGSPNLRVAGVQLEFPDISRVLSALDHLAETEANAPLLVLSEYTLDGPVPEALKAWCQKSGRYIIVGGKDPTDRGQYFDTAFVVGPAGEIVFRQAKSVPIPFLDDGLPATHQSLWNSPWGRIGICICYDASYTRVVDQLVRQGAQLIVVPSMDVVGWGAQEHESNARVGPVRAAEYGVPLFRLASSGISEAIDAKGGILARAPFPDEGAMLAADFVLAQKGTIPLDRWLAPCSVGIVVLLSAVHLFWRKKRKPSDPVQP